MQSRDRRFNVRFGAHHLHQIFLGVFQCAWLAEERLAAGLGPELSGAFYLPTALILVPDPAGAGREQGLLGGFEMRLGDVITEFVHVAVD